MAGADDGEMAAVEGGDLCKPKPFGDCHDGRVNAPKRKILVLCNQQAHALVVFACRLDRQRAHRERMQELGFDPSWANLVRTGIAVDAVEGMVEVVG